MATDTARRRPAWSVLAHAALVAPPLVWFAVAVIGQPPGSPGGANIGAGIAIFLLLPFGLPWTSPFVADPDLFTAVPDVVAFGLPPAAAVLNVVLHGYLVHRVRRRRDGGIRSRTHIPRRSA